MENKKNPKGVVTSFLQLIFLGHLVPDPAVPQFPHTISPLRHKSPHPNQDKVTLKGISFWIKSFSISSKPKPVLTQSWDGEGSIHSFIQDQRLL